VLLAALAAISAGAPSAEALILKQLNYETGNFNQWTGMNALPRDATIIRSPVHQGRFAARFVVRPGDNPLPTATGERAEVFASTNEQEGTESWWAWSTYFPTDFRPRYGTWNVFTQWHQTGHTCPSPMAFEVNNYGSRPKIRLHLYGGRLQVTGCKAEYAHMWDFARLLKNRWYNFRFHVKWSARKSIGFVQLWLNGRLVIPKTHVPTLYKGQGVVVRQGFYRGPDSKTTVIYHDGLRRFKP
jgi:Polysaccharide lyase